jgi:hypothetical protein
LFPDGAVLARTDELRKHSNDPAQERESIFFRLTHPGVPVLGAEEIAGNSDVFQLIGQFMAIRANHPALVKGRYDYISAVDPRMTYSFIRTLAQDTAAVVMNISNEPRIAVLKGEILMSHRWQDVVSKKEYIPDHNALSIELPACGFAVLQPLK